MNTPPPRLPARRAFGIAENGDALIIVQAIQRGRALSFSKAELSEVKSLPPRTVVSGCLLHRESFTRWLTAPIASLRKAETVFPSLLDIQIPFSVEDCEVALLETRPTADRTGTRGLIAGARHTDIEKRLTALSAAGVDPHILDQEAIALWSQSNDEIPVSAPAIARVVVYLAADRVTLAAGQGDELLGANTMRQMDAEQMHRLLKSYFPIVPAATQWLLTGPGATNQVAVESLQNAFTTRWPGSFKITHEPETFLARALAARALTPHSTPCNLRAGRFLHPALVRQNEKRPYQWAIACLVAGLLLCAVNLAWLAAVQFRLSGVQKQLLTLAIGINGSPQGIQPGQEALSARRAMDAQTKAMEPFLAATDRPLKNLLATILTVAQEEGICIETLILSRKNGVIHGLAPKPGQGEKVARRLNGNGWTTTIERKESPRGDERAAFVIGMRPSREK